jgi:hypothetical protein
MEGLLGPRAYLNFMEKRNLLPLPEIELPPLHHSPPPLRGQLVYRLSYPAIGHYHHKLLLRFGRKKLQKRASSYRFVWPLVRTEDPINGLNGI